MLATKSEPSSLDDLTIPPSVPMAPVGNPRHGARDRVPPATRRRALELLAGSRDGATEAILLANGFTIEQMVELVRAGLATAKAEPIGCRRPADGGRPLADRRGGAAGTRDWPESIAFGSGMAYFLNEG